MRFILCFVILLLSCKDKKIIDNENAIKVKTQELKISKKAIENFKFNEYKLSTEAQQIVSKWESYKELNDQINYLKEADLSFYKNEKKFLITFMSKLKTTVPDVLNTNSILSRLTIIETKVLKLNDHLIIDNIDVSTQLSSIREVCIAFSNLNLRINKLIEFNIYNAIQPE